jgi:hypothetical protein
VSKLYYPDMSSAVDPDEDFDLKALCQDGTDVAEYDHSEAYSPDYGGIVAWGNKLYTYHVSGCSCSEGGNIEGPFLTIKDAVRNLGADAKADVLREIG